MESRCEMPLLFAKCIPFPLPFPWFITKSCPTLYSSPCFIEFVDQCMKSQGSTAAMCAMLASYWTQTHYSTQVITFCSRACFVLLCSRRWLTQTYFLYDVPPTRFVAGWAWSPLTSHIGTTQSKPPWRQTQHGLVRGARLDRCSSIGEIGDYRQGPSAHATP